MQIPLQTTKHKTKDNEIYKMTELENVEQVTKDLNEWLGEMPYFPNTEYITINKDGIFVGGKPTIKYRGYYIYHIEYIKEVFKWMQEKCPSIAAFHVITSKTREEDAVGYPSYEEGVNVWCRIALKKGTESAWVFSGNLGSTEDSASYGARNCAMNVRQYRAFRAALWHSLTLNPVVFTANNNAQNKR